MGSALVCGKSASQEESKNRVCHLVIDGQRCGLKSDLQIFLSHNGGMPKGNVYSFETEKCLYYESLCDDFGPMNMLSVINFVEILDQHITTAAKQGCSRLVYCAGIGCRAITNAAFLLGSYMLLKFDMSVDDVNKCFGGLHDIFEGYRDASYATPDFFLSLVDCWGALQRGKSLGWIALPVPTQKSVWGLIDKDAIVIDYDPLNGDMNEVVPRRFLAFRGPKDLNGYKYRDIPDLGIREFGPDFYVDIFKTLGVSATVGLSVPEHDGSTFTRNGIPYHDLRFEDSVAPPPHIAAQFFDVIDAAKGGVVAVHCGAGLGRTGTLIAMDLIRSHGFSAREAIGWLRIMRPGSIVGKQQQFLCSVEESLRSSPPGARPRELAWEPPRHWVRTLSARGSGRWPLLPLTGESAAGAVEFRLVGDSDDDVPVSTAGSLQVGSDVPVARLSGAADAADAVAAAAAAAGGGGGYCSVEKIAAVGARARPWQPLPCRPAAAGGSRPVSPPVMFMVLKECEVYHGIDSDVQG